MIKATKIKATNKQCYFYNTDYANDCKACCIADCKRCNLFINKNDKRQIELDQEYQAQRNLLYYPNGSMR